MIFHITTEEQWKTAVSAGHYHHSSLDIEGFIHCSTREQILDSATKHFHGQTGLVLLCIVVKDVAAPVIYEDSYQSGQDFPHIYGQLNLDAVTQVIPFLAGENGSFHLPGELFEQPYQSS
jgi:uncharacterized protein (DUF952 family)